MTTSTSLIEFLLNLLKDPQAMAAYQEDAEGYLADCGVSGLSPVEVHDALVLLEDNQDADFSRGYNTGGNTVHVPPPAPAPAPKPGESDHEAGIRYLNTYVQNNYIDDRDTIVDHSINQQIDTGGGDLDQDFDIDNVVASGDGAVAAGGNIEDSTITTGDDNQVGDGNVKGDGNVIGNDNQAVTGDRNTTSFGEGDASSTNVGDDLNVGDGAGFATGGNASVDNTKVDIEDSFSDKSNHSINDSGNTDVEVSLEDVANETSTSTVEDSNNETIDRSVNNSNNDVDA